MNAQLLAPNLHGGDSLPVPDPVLDHPEPADQIRRVAVEYVRKSKR